jgi:hypothetical protein
MGTDRGGGGGKAGICPCPDFRRSGLKERKKSNNSDKNSMYKKNHSSLQNTRGRSVIINSFNSLNESLLEHFVLASPPPEKNLAASKDTSIFYLLENTLIVVQIDNTPQVY